MIAAYGFGIVALAFAGLFLAIMLAGMGAAALEAHRERRAGLPVSRPAWDARAARRAAGHRRGAYLRGMVKGLRS